MAKEEKSKTALEEVIREKHKKIIFSYYGILAIFTFLLPIALIVVGIVFMVTGGEGNNGIMWILIGLVAALFSFRRLKDFVPIYQYAICPKKYPTYVKLEEEGVDFSAFDDEIREANLKETLTKQNPIVITEHFIFGFSQVSFFFLMKEDIIWAYEYNGNGLVFYDRHKIYGFTFFPTVDGNTEEIEKLKYELPYVYYNTDFDYKTIMHTQFDETVEQLKYEREAFLANPDEYREEKARVEREKIEAETRRLEEERAKQMAEIDEIEEVQETQIIEGPKEEKENTDSNYEINDSDYEIKDSDYDIKDSEKKDDKKDK